MRLLPARVLILAATPLLLASLLPIRTPHAQTGGSTPIAFSSLPRSTQEHLLAAAWWPTKPLATPTGFVGTAVCAGCHSEIADTQKTSQMARTLLPAAHSTVLAEHLHDTFHSGPYTTSVTRSATGFTLHTTDGTATLDSVPQWAFGSGDVGQSYLWQTPDGAFHESRFNFFRAPNTFVDTPGRLHGVPVSLAMAGSRPIEGFEAQTCFRCHTTTMSSALPLETRTVVPGVSCEACHGPGAAHVAAVAAADALPTPPAGAAPTKWDRAILNPSRLSPADSVDLCGSCHSTPTDVRLMGAVGLQTVRFPAYRLTGSRCWLASSPAAAPGAGDSRLTCQSCHDPHAPLDRVAEHYDTACLRCHSNRAVASAPAGIAHVLPSGAAGAADRPASSTATAQIHPGRACPVATRQCTSCHMPEFALPEMHAKFHDHRIRIAHPGEPFPDAAPAQLTATAQPR